MFKGGRGGGGGGWRLRGGLQGFLPGQVLQRLAEQIIDDVEEAGFNSASCGRTSKRGSGGAVLRRGEALAVVTWKIGHHFCELHCILQSLALVFMRQSTEAFGRISCVFYVIVDPDPEVDSPFDSSLFC